MCHLDSASPPVPAAWAALDAAGVAIDQIDAVTTHNPFAVTDIYFSRQTEYPGEDERPRLQPHLRPPAGPTGLRSIVELIEELGPPPRLPQSSRLVIAEPERGGSVPGRRTFRTGKLDPASPCGISRNESRMNY